MDNIQIYFRVIAAILFFAFINSSRSYCQSIMAKELVLNSFDINDDSSKSYLKGNSVFIIITNKNCRKCFEDACNFLNERKKDYRIYGLVMMPKNYLELISTAQRYKDEIPCVSNFYFYFVTAELNDELRKINEMPSPQMIIKTGDYFEYLSYGEVLKLK
jgi:hypothetical protein